MKVTIEFESEEEQAHLLTEASYFGYADKEEIEEILSLYLLNALKSPLVRRAQRKELLKSKKP